MDDGAVGSAGNSEVETVADAMLSAIEQGLEGLPSAAEAVISGALDTTMSAVVSLGREFVRRYHRLEIDADQMQFDQPTLFVANHGFGGIFDLNVLAISATLEELDLQRPVTVLTHQLAWTLGVGPLIEPLGARPASHDSARQAFGNGHHVVVLPGGDVEAAKPIEERDQIVFGGRSGFARLAIEQDVPIVPIVTAGAGESLLVLSSGERLARALKLDELLRVKTLPVTVSLPWGLNVGLAGMLPYLPLPTKLHTRVLAPITHQSGETAEDFAERVRCYMQDALTEMTKNRRPLLG